MSDNPLTLEWDEDGLHLTLDAGKLERRREWDDGDGSSIGINDYMIAGVVSTSAALELYEHIVDKLGAWAHAGLAAKRAVAAGVSLQEFAGVETDEADIADDIEFILDSNRVERYLEAADNERKARRENG